MFKKIHEKSVVREIGFEFFDPPHVVNLVYEEIRTKIYRRDWV